MVHGLVKGGDMVLMERAYRAESGDTVVLRLKQEEVSLKKFFAGEDLFPLELAKSQRKPVCTPPDNIEIQDRVGAVVRGAP